MAVCPKWLIGLTHHFCWFHSERERKQLKIGSHSGMQSLSHYSPLNCSSLYFSPVHILMCFHLDILSFAGQYAFVVSHLMIPVWVARTKSHSSLSKSTCKRHFWFGPIKAPQVCTVYRNKCLCIAVIVPGECFKDLMLVQRCDELTKADMLRIGKAIRIKKKKQEFLVSRCDGIAHREWVITWDRCLPDLFHWTRADVLLFHAL